MPIRKKNPDDVQSYLMGRRDADKADQGQVQTTAEGRDPGMPKKGDAIGAYVKGYYDGALRRSIVRRKK